MTNHFERFLRPLACVASTAAALLVFHVDLATAQPAAASAAASAAKPAKRARHLLTRTPPTSNVPKSNNPDSPRNTGLGATGDGSGADASEPTRPPRKAASAAGK